MELGCYPFNRRVCCPAISFTFIVKEQLIYLLPLQEDYDDARKR